MSPSWVASFYHLYANGPWEVPVQEYLRALEFSDLKGLHCVGLVGSDSNRKKVRDFLPRHMSVVAEADVGYEQVTLRALHVMVKDLAVGTPVLYAHTKGTGFSVGDPVAQVWRHAMIHETVMTYPDLSEYDVAGAHWLDSPNLHFYGNFWWARSEYLAKLGPVGDKSRYDAELWLGTGNPRVLDLCPDFEDKWNLGWDYYTRSFRMGRECLDCPLLVS